MQGTTDGARRDIYGTEADSAVVASGYDSDRAEERQPWI